MEKEVLENHKNYLERVRFYRGFGYDLEKERDRILDKALPFSGEILDIGTGKGHFALALAKRGFSFTSIDTSAEEQRIAGLNIRYYGLEKQVVFRKEDAEHMSFPDRSFDVIFSVNVFHHLENPDRVLREIARLLRSAGKVVLSDFNAKGMAIINACHTSEGRVHDYFKHDLGMAKDFFTGRGFDVRESESDVQRLLVATENILLNPYDHHDRER